MDLWRKKKKKKEKEEETRKCFLKNGSMFLQHLIADCNGISNPIRMLSSDQISEATNNFDHKCYLDEGINTDFFTWYKGDIEGRHYAIKRYTERLYVEEEMAYNDIVLSSRVSNHNGFLKLIGCCLEFSRPVSVFEDLDYRVLNQRGTVGCEDAPLLPWHLRLKIAKDVATSITYLHTAFSRIIIHRNIKAENVLLDKNGKAKLSDFSLAVTLPEGKSWIETRWSGTCGYVDSGYVMTRLVSEYTDVHSFGVFMLVLLMGRPPIFVFSSGGDIAEYVKELQERGEYVVFGGDSNDNKPGQMKMFLELALRCCDCRSVDKPKMIMVAKEIKLIEEKGSFDCSELLENVSEGGQIKY
ncbi:hypothetical protein N665_0201s0444 [Sinapis alba]|nr:hypothetical protein N665_0201s0444 [Sinapis alba]